MAPTIITYGTNAAILGGMGYGGKFGYSKLLNYWVEAKPNEWLLIIRNGEQAKCAVGLQTWMLPGDAAVKFPSQLYKVYFTAE